MKILFVLVFVILGGLTSCDRKVDQKVSKLVVKSRIFDNADLLTKEQEDDLFRLIQSLENEIGSQIAIMTVVSLEGQPIEEYSLKIFERLGLGRAKFDDGILITVSETDRMMRIEVGYGLEKIVKDEIASRINREEMAPRFKENDYAGGLKKAIEKIITLIKNNKELVGQRL
jgi:uncharacterized protein